MRRWMMKSMVMTCAAIWLAAAGCSQHRVEVQPIKVEPIHLTVDVNVRVDREAERELERLPGVERAPQPPAPAQPGL